MRVSPWIVRLRKLPRVAQCLAALALVYIGWYGSHRLRSVAAQGSLSTPIPASGTISLSRFDEISLRTRRIVATGTGFAVAQLGPGVVRLASYDLNGTMQSTSSIELDSKAFVRDISVDAASNMAVLTRSTDTGETVLLKNFSDPQTETIPVQRRLENIVLLNGEVFALSGNDIVRVADNAVIGTLPANASRPFTTLPLRNQKILFVSQTAPELYTVDPTIGVVNRYLIDSPEIKAATEVSGHIPITSPPGRVVRDLIFTAAVDSSGSIYGLLSPFSQDHVQAIRFDESGNVLGVMSIALPKTDSPGTLKRAIAWNVVPSQIAVVGQRLLLYSRPHNLLVYYELAK